MACRIGITTDLQERKRFWQRRHPYLRDWYIIGMHFSKTSARQQENRYVAQRGCVTFPSGDGPEIARWYVYHFEY